MSNILSIEPADGGNSVRVGRINYMNVAPVYYGLDNGQGPAWMDITAAPPADLNALLADGGLDISPVSSAAYARRQEDWLLLPDLSISCHGPVMSVVLVSQYPLVELTGRTVMLTRESATAAALSRYLFATSDIHPRIVTGQVRRPTDLGPGVDAALVIGDAALWTGWAGHFEHVWELGELWRLRTGLPFVFALWAVRESYARRHPERVSAVHAALLRSRETGYRHLERIIPVASERLGISPDRAREYYQRLQYGLSDAHIAGVERFFTGLYEMNLIPRPVRPRFFQPDAGAGMNAA